MNTTGAVVLTGVTVAVGTWAEKNRGPSIRPVLALGFMALGLAAIGMADQELASKFAVLILAAAVFRYGIPITRKLGFK